jgi:hypothetical protein
VSCTSASKAMLHSCLQNGNLTRLVLSAANRSKGRRAIPARQSRAASCYTTASAAAALGHLGAVHKRGSGAKMARPREGWRLSANTSASCDAS